MGGFSQVKTGSASRGKLGITFLGMMTNAEDSGIQVSREEFQSEIANLQDQIDRLRKNLIVPVPAPKPWWLIRLWHWITRRRG